MDVLVEAQAVWNVNVMDGELCVCVCMYMDGCVSVCEMLSLVPGTGYVSRMVMGIHPPWREGEDV